MQKEALKKWYEKNHLSAEKWHIADTFLDVVEGFLDEHLLHDIDHLSIEKLDEVIRYMVITNQNHIDHFVVLMRYYRMINHHENFIHLTKYTGSYGVIESILAKLTKVAGQSVTKALLETFDIPILGTSPKEIASFTASFITWLEEHLEEDSMRRVLADNHHQIPKEAFMEEKIYYESAPTLEIYLKELHERKIKELEKFYHEGRVWFEQTITPEVIEYVKSNQEIMSAVLKDDALYITKIPYDTKAYLEAQTKQDENYYLCHCPFAREAIKHQDTIISANWCYCSGGFTKFPFDIIFDRDLKIEMLASALRGDGACRFKIDLKDIPYKR
jgi:hypothetical protein